jgi:hypothetical protein
VNEVEGEPGQNNSEMMDAESRLAAALQQQQQYSTMLPRHQRMEPDDINTAISPSQQQQKQSVVRQSHDRDDLSSYAVQQQQQQQAQQGKRGFRAGLKDLLPGVSDEAERAKRAKAAEHQRELEEQIAQRKMQ